MISANNAVYWMQNPLESAELSILRDIECGINGFPKHKQFAAAHLIALECVEPDFDSKTFKLTAKGEEALRYFSERDE
tara:strand:- start:1132 stop:1365 length:234 start_codon:yes stop_codon:yes gene_type:complete